MRKIVLYVVVGLLVCAGSATAAATITGSQVKDGSLTGKDVKNKSLSRADFRGSVRGPRGFAGNKGAQGAQGPAGPTGVAEIVSGQGTGIGSAVAYCPAGTRPISGGGIVEGDGFLWASGVIDNGGRLGWMVMGPDSSPMTAFAYCSAGVSKFTFPNGTARSSRQFENMARAKRSS
jgi:hypothetical protein